MADPLSVTASVIAVASLAHSSSMAVYRTISNIREAPTVFSYLKADLEALYRTLESFKQGLNRRNGDATLSEAQKSNLLEIKPALNACSQACDAFKAKIDKTMRHSTDDHVSLRDRLAMTFKEKEISVLQARLGSYRSTLTIALEFSVLTTTSENLDAVQSLETKIEGVSARLEGQMQGLQMGLQAILDANDESRHRPAEAVSQYRPTEPRASHMMKIIEEQNTALSHCYQACMAALRETTKATGHEYKFVKASSEARLLMGDLGNVGNGAQHHYSNIEVSGRVVAGNMEGQYAKDFFQ